METSVLGSPNYKFLQRLSVATRMQLGDLSRQLTLLRAARARRIDVIVCAEMGFARGLGLLRRWKLLRTPIVGVLHPYEPRSRVARYAVGGFDRVLCLSSEIERALQGFANMAKVTTAPIGPDLAFVGYQPEPGTAVVSTGRTHRDLGLLARASATAGCELTIHGASKAAPSPLRTEKIGAAYSEIFADLRAAAIVAIPLRRTDGCFGITEFNDALAQGKPILMTRNRYIDVDIEAIGCGRWIELDDEDAWVNAISELMSDPSLRAEMGSRGKAYAESSWNYRIYCEALIGAVRQVVEPSP
jgi:glycosyltransferase involved in cell wall biosynthesis